MSIEEDVRRVLGVDAFLSLPLNPCAPLPGQRIVCVMTNFTTAAERAAHYQQLARVAAGTVDPLGTLPAEIDTGPTHPDLQGARKCPNQ